MHSPMNIKPGYGSITSSNLAIEAAYRKTPRIGKPTCSPHCAAESIHKGFRKFQQLPNWGLLVYRCNNSVL